MRIVGGKFRGIRLKIPKAFRGRPTTDFAKEGLFNVLNNLVEYEDLKILDLFSGTGSISYEFTSRGSSHIMAIDKSIVHCNYINKMFREFESEKSHCYKKDAYHFIISTEQTFDLIFADPPFDDPDLTKLPNLIFEEKILNPNGIFILEHGERIGFGQHPNFMKEKKYGHDL